MERITSKEFLKMSLQLLALQFPDIVIRYGLNIISTTMHVVELTPENELETNKCLSNACFAIYKAFDARFSHEDMVFTHPDPVLCIKELILELNEDIEETERLLNGSPLDSIPERYLDMDWELDLDESYTS
jgi:hypothetical protein